MVYSYTVCCLIYGEQTQCAFTVEIDEDKTVSVLKELIVVKNPNYFKGVDARQLCLWKVSIRNNDEQAIQRAHLDDSNLLHPMCKMYRVFDHLDDEHIHIMVKPPGKGTFLLFFFSFFFFHFSFFIFLNHDNYYNFFSYADIYLQGVRSK